MVGGGQGKGGCWTGLDEQACWDGGSRKKIWWVGTWSGWMDGWMGLGERGEGDFDDSFIPCLVCALVGM